MDLRQTKTKIVIRVINTYIIGYISPAEMWLSRMDLAIYQFATSWAAMSTKQIWCKN